MQYENPAPPPYGVYPNSPEFVPVVVPYGMQIGADVAFVRDYLAWSIINLFCGWGVFGVIPLVFSILCRNSKNINDYHGAHTMSTLALISNIIITAGGLIGWIAFIVVMVIYVAAINSTPYGGSN